MKANDIILGIVFSSQTTVGVLGNAFLICLFIVMLLTGHRLRPIDTIFAELACFNSLLLLSNGLPQAMAALGLKNFFNDNGCIILFYIHKVSRGLSLSSTCLLSGFQAITICPRGSCWAEVKARAPKYIMPISCLSCITHLLLNIIVFMKLKNFQASRNSSRLPDFGYCSSLEDTNIADVHFGVVVSLRDALLVSLMVFSSGYMILLLHQHHKQHQHLYVTNLFPRHSPLHRATQSILLQVSTFVCFYALNTILISYMYLRKPNLLLMQCSAFLCIGFPTFSPFLLISSDSQFLKYCHLLSGRNVPHL
ncbi:vomeronasal type-1 receptor 4-like [Macrotis lagotis]|uniref:vomeronasal type-1 receptor 4-like n=1 Tax=Macrotis lagotis TaxID=92651 RepID=UPI003D686BE8